MNWTKDALAKAYTLEDDAMDPEDHWLVEENIGKPSSRGPGRQGLC